MINNKKIKKIEDEKKRNIWYNRLAKRNSRKEFTDLISKKHISLFKKIKWIYQRARYGYCDMDWYDMNNWLCSVLSSLLEDFSFNCVGSPLNVEYEDWQNLLIEIADYLDDAGDDEMENPYSKGFHVDPLNREAYIEWENKRQEERISSLKKAFDLISKWFFDLWD